MSQAKLAYGVGHRLSLRSQADPQPTDRTQLSLPFNGLHLVNHVIIWITTHLPTLKGWKAELA